jgi:hypothetical protein
MKILERWLLKKILSELAIDKLVFGTTIFQTTKRHRWNPMRWILGDRKFQRIDPLTFKGYLK